MGTDRQPLLPLRRPWWVLVIGAMLVFGFYQELAKLHLNDYLSTLADHPKLDDASPAERAAFWAQSVPPRIVNYYEITEPWPVFHHMSFTTLRLLKWLLGAGILALFFTLDALFLRVTGNGDLRTALLGVYAFVGTLMLVIAALAPGSAGYDVARELLGFLQSPLPSFMLVFVRWMLARMQQPRT